MSHIKGQATKKGEDQDIRRRIKTKGSYRNSTTHTWAAGNPRARGAKCWGSKLTTAQGPKKNNTLGYPIMKKEKKKEEMDEKSLKNWDPKNHDGIRL